MRLGAAAAAPDEAAAPVPAGFLAAAPPAARGAGRVTGGLLTAVAVIDEGAAGRTSRWLETVSAPPRRDTLLGMLGNEGAAAVRLLPRSSLMSQALRLRLSLARWPNFMGSGEAARAIGN